MTIDKNLWIALAIGNSRLHWALMRGKEIIETLDTPYLEELSRGGDIPFEVGGRDYI